MDARDAEILALRREIQRLQDLLEQSAQRENRQAYRDLVMDLFETDYGRPFPEERV